MLKTKEVSPTNGEMQEVCEQFLGILVVWLDFEEKVQKLRSLGHHEKKRFLGCGILYQKLSLEVQRNLKNWCWSWALGKGLE